MAVFVPFLKQHGMLEQTHFTVCIVGSRKLLQEDDYGSGAWSLLAPNLTIYGFDADADACDLANADLQTRQVDWTEHHIPLALAGTVGTATLYVTGHPSCSSLYPPNEPYISRFLGFQESMTLNFTVEVETTTIDTFWQQQGLTEIDFLQVDVQGADLDVLKGATQRLQETILGVQVEVEFAALYRNQPLFTDIDLFLREHHFTLFDLITTNPWCRCPRALLPLQSAHRTGQLTWADACYFRDPIATPASPVVQSPDRILKLACIADILNFPDYALELLHHLTVNYGHLPQYNATGVIVEVLSQFPALVEQGIESLPVVASLNKQLS